MGIKRFQFVATLDNRTSDICQAHDHKIYNVSEAAVGENVPPLHVNCRSRIAPYISREYMASARIARDPDTERNYYVDNMSYSWWMKNIVNKPSEPRKITIGKTQQDAIPKIAGVVRGKPMTHEEADSGKVNPNFGQGEGYDTNCQTCVAVYEARLRGYDVEALPRTSQYPELDKLAKASYSIWYNVKEGRQVTQGDFIIGRVSDKKMTNASYLERLKATLQKNARYNMSFILKKEGSRGHVVSLLTDKDGNITIYDPQCNKKYAGDLQILSYLGKRVKWKATFDNEQKYIQPRILRIDDKDFMYDIANKIMRKAQHSDRGRKNLQVG